MLMAKSLKCTIVLDPAHVAGLQVPESGKSFNTWVQVGGHTIQLPLNGKSARKALSVIKEHGAENVTVIVQGKLKLGPALVLEEAGIMAQPKQKKEAPPAEVPAEAAAA